MALTDNPAGRLHQLLTRLAEVNPKTRWIDAWAQVLDVERDMVPLHLGAVGQLVREAQDAVAQTGSAEFLAHVERYRSAWAGSVFPISHSLNTRLEQAMPDPVALEALGAVAAHLHAVAPEGRVPEADELGQLTEDLQNLINDVTGADDLPDEMKHEVIARLKGVAQAIDHIAIGGPRAIQLAMEALVGGLAIREIRTLS